MNKSRKSLALVAFLAAMFISSCVHEPDLSPLKNGTYPTDPNAPCDPALVYFENDILPILRSNCAMQACHDANTQADGIQLTDYSSLMQSGVVKAGNPAHSDLWESITETDPGDRMPLGKAPLSAEQKDLIRRWIAQGAQNNRCNSGCDTTVFSYAAAVAPILQTNCNGCHSGSSASAGIRLEQHNEALAQVQNGKLMGSIQHKAGFKAMPYGGGKLNDCEIRIIEKWVEDGAPNN